MTATRPFGRTGEHVSVVWRERTDGSIDAGPMTGLIVTADDLDRRGGERVRARVAAHGRPFDFLLLRGLLANDLKVGWPLHRVGRFRDERLCRHTVVETNDALEAEWIAANAPVHGVVLVYEPADLSARFRVFDAAANANVALIGHATDVDAAALHLATPQLLATLLAPGVAEPEPLTTDVAETLWAAYAAANAPPPKLRSGHPPDYGT